MGIPPKEPEYGEDNYCFPTQLAPDKLILVISGVIPVSWWVPTYGTASNGYRWLYQVASTVCESTGAVGLRWRITFTATYTWLQAPSTTGTTCFTAYSPHPCQYRLPNDYQGDGQPFKFGWGQVVVPYGVNNVNSIEYAAAQAGIPFVKGTYYEPILSVDGILTHRFSRLSDGMCVGLQL